MANYIFVRAHDSEVQTVIADIIRENINPNTDGLTFTMDELKQAFKIYNEDMRKADKIYAVQHPNCSCSHAPIKTLSLRSTMVISIPMMVNTWRKISYRRYRCLVACSY